MIIPAQGLRIALAVRPVDFRCGHDALAGLVQNTLGLDPHSGLIVVFRSKRADRLKILLWDGTGLVLIYTRLGEGHFEWPRISDGVLRPTRTQFETLFDGLRRRCRGEVSPTPAITEIYSSMTTFKVPVAEGKFRPRACCWETSSSTWQATMGV